LYSCAPTGIVLDIKKSKYRKVSTLLHTLASETGIITIGIPSTNDEDDEVEINRDILYLLEFTRKHELYKGIKVESPEEFRKLVSEKGNT
jgi:hypothetical protein